METNVKQNLSQNVALKALIIGGLIILMLIPTFMIRLLVDERKERSKSEIEKISEQWSGSQTILGPIITIPYTVTVLDENKKANTIKQSLTITPEELQIRTTLHPEERKRSIYKAIVYKSEVNIEAIFTRPDVPADANFQWDNATLSLMLEDLRGISSNMTVQVEDKSYTLEVEGSSYNYLNSLATSLNHMTLFKNNETVSISCNFDLKGSQSMNFIPIGKLTHVKASGEWTSPGYDGKFLPDTRKTENGIFQAEWKILSFNRSIPSHWTNNNMPSTSGSRFGVNLINTVDHYQQNERCAKYAIMFLVLTFAIFFFVEVLTKRRIHPMQYILVGAGLVLFYSLLLACSEQLAFGWSYLISSIAIIGLISCYSLSIFRNKKLSGMLMIFLTMLYTFLYVVIQLEEVALLIGSIGLFIILGVIMFTSRNVNWYKVERREE